MIMYTPWTNLCDSFKTGAIYTEMNGTYSIKRKPNVIEKSRYDFLQETRNVDQEKKNTIFIK